MECIPKTKRVELAVKTHEENGHFRWDHTRLKLRDKWFWPGMDRNSKAAITECSHCRKFGPRHINSLLQLIKRREPFDLICADYLSLPTGKGGFKMILLLIDTFSNFIWAYKLKSTGTGKTTLSVLMDLCCHYR